MKTNAEINEDNQAKQQAVSGHVEPVVILRTDKGETTLKIWIEDLIKTFKVSKYHYTFYEYLASDSVWFEERRSQMIPKEYEERRKATMLEF
jgi:hypothetical protein